MGFVRLALQHGADLVPTYAFGLSDIFTTKSWFYATRKWLQKRFRVAIPFFHGRGYSEHTYHLPYTIHAIHAIHTIHTIHTIHHTNKV
jgi:hypothetical protein